MLYTEEIPVMDLDGLGGYEFGPFIKSLFGIIPLAAGVAGYLLFKDKKMSKRLLKAGGIWVGVGLINGIIGKAPITKSTAAQVIPPAASPLLTIQKPIKSAGQ